RPPPASRLADPRARCAACSRASRSRPRRSPPRTRATAPTSRGGSPTRRAGSAAPGFARRGGAVRAAAGSEHHTSTWRIAMTDWLEDDHDELAVDQRWPMAHSHLFPRERWLWWEQLWADVIALGERYRVRPCKDWWE